jgi:hypothetical protein
MKALSNGVSALLSRPQPRSGKVMKNRLTTVSLALWLGIGCLALGLVIVGLPEAGGAVLAGVIPVAICLWVILQDKTDQRFLLRVFWGALAARWAVGLLIFYKGQQGFFGGDAVTYDAFSYALCQAWQGLREANAPWLARYLNVRSSGWGMFYWVAGVYYLLGRNPLAIQLINAAFGAAACMIVYKMARLIHPEPRVARVAALLTAFAPSLVLWSSQALKDAPIVLCLCLCMLYALKLRERFTVKSLVWLLVFLFCLYSLRHYAFYILFVAVGGTLVFGAKRLTPVRVLQGGLLVLVLGLAFAYFGAGEAVQGAFDLKHIQRMRSWGAKVSTSGFGGEVDITDPEAALGFLPIGVLYVLFAPFPWMINNLRQLITLPELIAWWALTPLMLRGYWFALRHRLRESFTVCLFTLGLVLAYALYQSNVGTAYRHRAQLYVFFVIFISIGLELRRSAKRKRLVQPSLQPVALPSLLAATASAAANKQPD